VTLAPLTSVDRALGRALGAEDPVVECLVALTSRALSEGHVCLPLSSPHVLDAVRAHAEASLDAEELLARIARHPAVASERAAEHPAAPEHTAAPEAVSLVPRAEGPSFGVPRIARPLVLDAAHRLYLARYYQHEQRLARCVAGLLRARTGPAEPAPDRLALGLDPDQAQALSSAQRGGLTIVSGGPGTGKTSTVVRILAALIEQARRERGTSPRALLLAPTGKAAVRLSVAISAAKGRLQAPPEVLAALPEQGSTIHRALGVLSTSRTRFRHGPQSPLDADIVVVDEASMVDLALMRHLVEALAPGASLVLLGDRDQLSSVDAGNVLAELCDALEADPDRGRGALCQLTRSHRFDGGGLGAFAASARSGDAARIREHLESAPSGVRLIPSASPAKDPALLALAVAEFRAVREARDPGEALRRLGAFRVLCAHRSGPFGVSALNRAILDALSKERLVPASTEYFHGRPLLILESDPVLGLMNGDVGLVWTSADGAPSVLFERPERDPLAIAPAHLPAHETAFAMTVHKSQGSEFEHVAVVLPPAESPLATRELLYTAITRARTEVTLLGDAVALEVGLGRAAPRASGLSSAIQRELGQGEGKR